MLMSRSMKKGEQLIVLVLQGQTNVRHRLHSFGTTSKTIQISIKSKVHLRLMKQDGTAFVAWFNEEDTERALFEALKTPVHAFLAACIMATVQGD